MLTVLLGNTRSEQRDERVPRGKARELMRAWAGAISPAHAVLSAVALALARVVIGPVNDLDIYWHVLIGREALARHTVSGLGAGWLGVAEPPWTTSQWLAEVLFARTQGLWGWRGIVVLQAVLLAGLLITLAATLLPRRPVLLAVPITALVALGAASVVQDRPQSLAFIFLPVIGFWCVRLWETGRRPPLPVVALTCLLWAQLHGLWILAPAAFALAAVAIALGGPQRTAAALRGALLALLASLAGLVNPQGPQSFLLPLRFRDATPMISEWRPTALDQLPTWVWAAVIIITVLAWMSPRTSATRVEVVWVAAWWAFGILAYRNVVPSLLLIAPVCLSAADRAWGRRARQLSRPSGRREQAALITLTTVTLAAALGVGAGRALTVDPLANAPAVRIAERLAAAPHPVRVFNSYNASGALALFGGGNVRLVVDGRADMWGAAYIGRVIAAQELQPGWQQTFADFHPDAVVLTAEAPLSQALLHDGSWQVAMTDGKYQLLLPVPGHPAAAAAQ